MIHRISYGIWAFPAVASGVTAAINQDDLFCLSYSLMITGGNLYDKILRQKDKLFEEEVIWTGLRERWGCSGHLAGYMNMLLFFPFYITLRNFLYKSGDWHPSSVLSIANVYGLSDFFFLFSSLAVSRQYKFPREEKWNGELNWLWSPYHLG